MEESLGGSGYLTPIYDRAFNRFLKNKGVKCGACGGAMKAITYQELGVGFLSMPPGVAVVSSMDVRPGLLVDMLAPPEIFAMPAMCDNCGRIDMFSYGKVLRFSKGETSDG